VQVRADLDWIASEVIGDLAAKIKVTRGVQRDGFGRGGAGTFGSSRGLWVAPP
jgi:hypothetical protein